MTILHRRAIFAALTVLALGGAGFAAPAPALPTDDQLKATALKLNDLSDEKEMDAKLLELVKDKAAAKRLVAIAAKMQADAKPKDAPFKFNAALVLGKLAQNAKEYKAAESFYKFCKAEATTLQSAKKLAQAYDALIDTQWDQKNYAEVEELCAEVISLPGEEDLFAVQSFAIERIILSKSRRGDHDEALNMVENIIKGDRRKGWYPLQLKGSVLYEAGKIDQAIETYEEVLKKLEKDKDLKDEAKTNIIRNVRYRVTGLHVENKDVAKAAEILQALIKEVPDSATYKNDLGFIWADNDLKLEESEKLIREALDLDKKARDKALKEDKIDAETAKKANAAYQDSLGWVLYKNKKYDEAIKLLTEASLDEEEGQHMEIWDHLADAYLATKDTKKAIELWSKALKFEDVSKRDAERGKKITEKLKKAKAALKTDGEK